METLLIVIMAMLGIYILYYAYRMIKDKREDKKRKKRFNRRLMG